MKPFSIALSINLAFFAIWGLFFTLGINRPELIPLMTSLQTAINVLFAVGFFVDRKKPIGMAFVWTAAIAGVVTVAAYLVLINDIELDREKKRVSRGGREIDLGPTEYRLLEFLMERPGRVFSREQLLDGVWGSEVYIDERTVDVHVGRLRKALNRGREADPIRTVRGAGYALDDRFGRSVA